MLSQQKFLLSYVSMELGTGTHIIMVIEQIINRIYFHLKTGHEACDSNKINVTYKQDVCASRNYGIQWILLKTPRI